jgi:outer membrane beta-barrel protein
VNNAGLVPGRRVAAGWMWLGLMLCASHAMAQDGEAPAEAPVEAPAEAPEAAPVAEQAPAPSEAPPAEAAKGPAVSEDDETMEWAKRRGVETVQKRAVQKVDRLSATVYTGMIPNNIFERYYPVGLRLDYYILENIGVELSGAYAFASDTGLIDELSDPQGTGATGVLLGDSQLAHFNFGVTWSPVFGKTSFLNGAINYFDIYLFAGFGLLVKQTEKQFGAPKTTGATPEGALGAGMSFFLSNDWAMRLDYRQFIFQKGTGGVANPSEVSLGLSYFLF